jgi:hypothetical protein
MFTKANQQQICYESEESAEDGDTESCDQESCDHESCDQESKEEDNKIITETPAQEIVEDLKPRVNEVVTEDIFEPTQSDTLFWCLFIIHFGYEEYKEVQRNYGVMELEVKKKIGEFISANPHTMKTTNVKITKGGVQEILSELLTSQKETSMQCLMAILVYYKFNVMILNSTKTLSLEYISNKDESLPTYVLYKDTYNKYKVNVNQLTEEEINTIRETTICLENYAKPMRGISSYKVSELEDIAMKMGIYNQTKKYKKTELYEEIAEACKWT